MTAGDGRGRRAVGRGLPAPLAERLAAGHWLRTAHRGAPTVAPGNSRAAIVAAAALGVDMVEVDVHATADGALALWHDDDLPAGDARLPLAATTLAELQRVDLGRGERLITLADAMAAVRGRAALLVDLKADGLAEPIVATARRLDFGPVVVCGGYWGSLCDVKRLAPEIGTSLTLERHWRAWHGDDAIERADTDALTVDARLLGEPGLLDRCHARGLAVLAWTVDRPEDMRRLLALGVDGLTSNRPDRFAALLGSRAAPAG
ncbi:MAG TPA: glycerophosphodiester phosphodiesterase [Thermomicrobiales bacterium]|nr:glycerophosphodiester phosphodiesterase [Thermomicrobiales bacterium]